MSVRVDAAPPPRPYSERVRTRTPAIALTVLLSVAIAGCGIIPVPLAPTRPADTEREKDFGSVEVYDVEAGALVPPADDEATSEVWDLFVRVVTPEFAARGMSRFRAVTSPDSDTLAYVYRSDDAATWVLAANLSFADDEDLLLSTLVHEYGHILSLSADEVPPDDGTCDTWQTSEGCVEPASALARFQERFWAGYDDAPQPDDDDADAAYEFYLAHEADFVSDYAATNVVEDFAETFMTFVLETPPAGRSLTARKLAFFDDLPQYRAERERIRAEFGWG